MAAVCCPRSAAGPPFCAQFVDSRSIPSLPTPAATYPASGIGKSGRIREFREFRAPSGPPFCAKFLDSRSIPPFPTPAATYPPSGICKPRSIREFREFRAPSVANFQDAVDARSIQYPTPASTIASCAPTAFRKSRCIREFRGSSGTDFQDVASSTGSSKFGGFRGSKSQSYFGECGAPRSSWSARPSRRRAWHCRADFRGQEDASTVKEIVDLSESLLSLKGVVTSEYRAIGPEMRDRVGRLYERVVVLRQSADRAVSSGTSIPTHLAANLIALQREHGSLENIVRLAMEASPALEILEASVGRPNVLSAAASNLLLEEAKPKASAFQSLIRESDLEPVKSAPKYVMSAAASKGSSPLAAFRAEIERRVIEQLTGKKLDTARRSSVVPSTLPDMARQSSLPAPWKGREQDEVSVEKHPSGETSTTQEQNNGQGTSLSATEAAGTVAFVEDKLKQLELELAKSIPLQVFEQKVSKINVSLSEARAKVTQLNNEVMEKEAMLAAVKENMLAEQELLMQRVRELTGDLEKKISVEDMEEAVNLGLKKVQKELEDEQRRAYILSIELEKKEKSLIEQQENWRIQKQEMEMQLEKEHDRTVSLSLELEEKDKLMTVQQEEWNLQKLGLQLELKTVLGKWQEVRKKRTKERAQLAEKKQQVKLLEQELTRIQENMEEADRVRLRKKEATYATVRALISQMVLSARARAESEEHATTLVQEMAKLQEEKQALELASRAAEEKAGLAEIEVDGIQSNLSKVGKEVANLQGELLSGEKAAALEKFFGIMGKLIKQESENIDESLEDDYLSGNELTEDDGLESSVDNNLAHSGDDWDQDEQDINQTITKQKETSRE